MTKITKAVFFLLGLTFAVPMPAQDEQARTENHANNLTMAVAWKQTAAEYRALYHQGFNLARMHIENALQRHRADAKPLAIISDVDETLLLSSDYWGYLIEQQQDFFDDASWDRWVAENRSVASPGALEFLEFCAENNVEIFYVTNRDQGETTYALAAQNLRSAGFPSVDDEHLTVLRESSNKEIVQQQIRESHEVVVLLGDNLNDFSRRYYSVDVDERLALMEEDRQRYGNEYIVFPNPTDGHWIRAIFGDSEPPPSAANREILKQAAARRAWRP